MADFSQVAVSAPSKLILHGEHSVVYGKTALAGSLDLRTRMILKPNSENSIIIDFPDIQAKKSWKTSDVFQQILSRRPSSFPKAEVDTEFLKVIYSFLREEDDEKTLLAYACFFYLYSYILQDTVIPMKIVVESEIPIGAGLGSSAALSVCLAAGLLHIKAEVEKALIKPITLNEQEICELALISEKILHGTASGVDNSVSTYGGIMQFVSGQVSKLPSFPRLKILLVNSNVSRSTKAMVERVRQQFVTYPEVITPILEAMDNICLTCVSILGEMAQHGDTKERYDRLRDLIDYNQKLLESLGVSHPRLEEACVEAKKHGLSGKLTGAGGGGFAFILIPPNVSVKNVTEAKKALVKQGFTCWETSLGVNGVQVQIQNQ